MEPCWSTFGVLMDPMVAIKTTPQRKMSIFVRCWVVVDLIVDTNIDLKHDKNKFEFRREKKVKFNQLLTDRMINVRCPHVRFDR